MNHQYLETTNKLTLGYKLYMAEQSPTHNALRHKLMSFRQFKQSWRNLAVDHYLRDGGHYRLRRYSVFHYRQHKGRKQLDTLPHEAHFQGKHYNHLHGGIKRDYKDWVRTTQNNPAFKKTVEWAVSQITTSPSTNWRIQAHQFRIIATQNQQGKPTPEGIHKDGADFILIMLLDRKNVKGGVSRIFTNDKQLINEVQLQEAGDTIILDDNAVWHGVTPIEAIDPNKPAWRDVMVLTFHR